MRKNIAAGNWKMNLDLASGKKLASEVINMVNDEVQNDAEVILIPPFTHLTVVKQLIGSSTSVHLGAQNCSDQKSGAFTGEISTEMLQSVGVEYVVVGHSERRDTCESAGRKNQSGFGAGSEAHLLLWREAGNKRGQSAF